MKFVLAVIICLFALPVAPAFAEPVTGATKANVLARLKALVDDTDTLRFRHTTWQTDGEDIETTAGQVYVQKTPLRIRIDVEEGRGSGATAIYENGTVTGFMGGLLSFAKLSYDVRDEEVLGLRGDDMRATGFLDDMARILEQSDSARIEKDVKGFLIRYKHDSGLPAVMALDPKLLPRSIVVKEAGKVVDRQTFSEIVRNPSFDDEVFDP